MAATDSYRLSVKETEITEGPAGEVEAIVPARRSRSSPGIAQASDADSLTVGIQENQIVFGVEQDLAHRSADRRAVPRTTASFSRSPLSGSRASA